jgi:hypothetical protein
MFLPDVHNSASCNAQIVNLNENTGLQKAINDVFPSIIVVWIMVMLTTG